MQNGELSFPNGQNSISLYFFSQNQSVDLLQVILFQYTNVLLCAKFGGLKPTIDEKRRKCFINVNLSSGSTDRAEVLGVGLGLRVQGLAQIWLGFRV